MRLIRLLLAITIALIGLLPSAAAAMFFADVPDTHPYAKSIDLLREREIVQGFVLPGERRIFWPDQPVTRAEFVAMIVRALAPQTLIDGCLTDQKALKDFGLQMNFSDVPEDAWFAPSVCVAWAYRFISGYGDGSFRPDRPIPLAEAAKILSTAFSLAPVAVPDLIVLAHEWYQPFIEPLTVAQAVPPSVRGPQHILTRAEVAEMLARLLKLPSDQPPAQRIALDKEEVTNPIEWKTFTRNDLGFSLSYPSVWPEPWVIGRTVYESAGYPKARSLWKVYIGPMRSCWGWNDCVETDFSLTAFPRTLLTDTLAEMREAKDAAILSDQTVGHQRTILFETTDSTCTARSAFLVTPDRYLRFSLHCGSALHNPETAFMRMLAKLKVEEK